MTAALTLAKLANRAAARRDTDRTIHKLCMCICYVGQSNNNRRRAQITDDFALLR